MIHMLIDNLCEAPFCSCVTPYLIGCSNMGCTATENFEMDVLVRGNVPKLQCIWTGPLAHLMDQLIGHLPDFSHQGHLEEKHM